MNKYYIKFILFAFLYHFACFSYSQPTNNFVGDAVMPAPNVAALGKYGDIPVSNYTGTPGIGLPIYTLQEGPLSLPVNLSYHASGIKVGELASWVGQGWSLQAGGMITRTVLGIADEEAFGYYNYGNNITTDRDTILEVGQGDMDAQPDLFTYNFNGYVGKFYLDEDNLPFFMPKQDFKIHIGYSSNEFNYFIITTPDGTKYHFGDLPGQPAHSGVEETTSFSNGNNDGSPINSSWYLVKVESFDGKYKIDLEYVREFFKYKNLSTCSITYQPITACSGSGSSIRYDECIGFSDDGGTTFYTRTEMAALRLSKITTTTATMDFVVSSQMREDVDSMGALNPAAPLEKIKLTTGSYCTQWKFFYDYFENSQTSNKSENFRLKLDSLQQMSCDSAVLIPPHKFTYEGTTNSNGSSYLPGRLSKAMDHWGFYNGQSSNNSEKFNLPESSVIYGGLTRTHGDSDRETDTTKVKYGVIEEIIYPTGGRTKYEFEAHQYSDELTSGETDLLTLANCTTLVEDCCTTPNDIGYYTFESYELTYAKFELLILVRDGVDECIQDGQGEWPDGCISCSVDTPNVVTLEIWDGANKIDSISLNTIFDADSIGPTLLTSEFPSLVAGTNYQFKLIVENGKGDFRLYTDIPTGVTVNQYAGGLRIKSITTSEDDTYQNGDDIVRTYEYISPSDSTESSGKLIVYPKYADGFTVDSYGQGTFGLEYKGEKDYAQFRAGTMVPLTGGSGIHLGYEVVTEYHNGNGKRRYFFNINQLTSIDLQFLSPPSDFRPGDSKLLRQETYQESGTKISQTRNVPKALNPTSFSGVTYLATLIGDGICFDYSVYNKLYYPYSAAYLPDSTIVDLDGVQTITTYTFDESNHLNPTSIKLTNSDDKEHLTTTKYFFDLPSGSLKDSLESQNRILPALSTRLFVEDTLVGGDSLEYAMFTTTGLLNADSTAGPYPYQFYKYEMTFNASGNPMNQAWDTIGTISEYDTQFFQPKKIKQRGWEEESFTWNSDGLITNRTYKDFSWQYEYFTDTRLVSKITDIDGQEVDYVFDKLMRLDSVKAREDNVITKYTYAYQSGSSSQNSVTTSISFTASDSSELNSRTTIQYLDGLGRPIQTVEKEYSDADSPKDIVSAIAYDKQGRAFKAYEVFLSDHSDGRYVDSTDWPDIYTLTEYEASPLNRQISVTPPDWYATTTSYGKNSAAMGVAGETYQSSELSLTTVTDPNGHKTLTFTDKKGRTVLVQRIDSSDTHYANTQYAFDDKDRLTLVMPPGATSTSDTDLVYSYTYDERDNILTKKIPDQNAITYMYSIRNLMTYMQDGNMADQGRWLHTQYDDYGRAIESGFVTNTPDSGGEKGNFAESLTKTCYDGCDFVGTVPDIYLGKVRRSETRILGTTDWLQSTFFYDTHGRVALSESNHHLNIGDWQAETVTFKYDYADNITYQNRVHKLADGRSTTILEKMAYDHSGRLKRTHHKVDGGSDVMLSSMSYTAKDQVLEKNIGKVGSSFLQSLDYDYLDNGFLTSINQPTLGGTNLALAACPPGLPAPGAPTGSLDNKDLFYMQLHYDSLNTNFGASKKQYNGNISQITWRVRGRERQVYGFEYDWQDRLTSSTYGDQNDAGTLTLNNRYSTTYEYDSRGNIEKLTREGFYWDGSCWAQAKIDSLAYSYIQSGGKSTNRLKTVTENLTTSAKNEGFKPGAGGDYTYDFNGNMDYDPNKDMEILYNYLNLPRRIEIEDCKFIEFLYDASGTKLRKTLKEGAMVIRTQDYIGGLEYTNDSLEAIYHSEGRVYFENGMSRYEYNLSDHLGNTRLTFSDKDGDGVIEIFENADSNEVLSEHHYYPFGMNMNGKWMSNKGRATDYKYNGKELNQDFGLDWYDYGARWYDAAIGRWNAVDPLAEPQANHSTYAYTFNNPIAFFDPTGMMGESIGADGLTNEQWIASSRPGADEGLADSFKEENRKNEIEKVKSGNDWIPLTRDKLKQLGSKFRQELIDQGYDGAILERLFWAEMGRILEPAVLMSIEEMSNSKSYNKAVPDAVGTYYNFFFWEGFANDIFFFEVKVSAKVPSWSDQWVQLTRLIKHLGDHRVQQQGITPILTIITPSGSKIDDRLLNYADQKNVVIMHAQIETLKSNNRVIRVTPGVPVNKVPLQMPGVTIYKPILRGKHGNPSSL